MDVSVWELLDAGFRPCRRGTFAETKGPRRVETTPHIIFILEGTLK